MKRFIVFMLLISSLFVCAACQPTPTETIAQSKADEAEPTAAVIGKSNSSDDTPEFVKFITEYANSQDFTDRDASADELSQADAFKVLKEYLEPLGLSQYADKSLTCNFNPLSNGACWKLSYSDENIMFYADIDAKTGILLSTDIVGLIINAPNEELIYNISEKIINMLNSSENGLFKDGGEYYKNEHTYTQNGVAKQANTYELYSLNKMLMINASFIKSDDGIDSFSLSVNRYVLTDGAENLLFAVTEYLDVDDAVRERCNIDENTARVILDNELTGCLTILGEKADANNVSVKSMGLKRVSVKQGLVNLYCFEVTGSKTYNAYIDPELSHISCITFRADRQYSEKELMHYAESFSEMLGLPHMSRKDVYSLSEITCAGEFLYDDYYDELGEDSINWGILAAQSAGGDFSLYFTRNYPRN